MQRVLIALSAAAMASAFPITADSVNCREGAGTDTAVVTTYAAGTEVEVVCQTEGEVIEGSAIWDQTQDGCYVTDIYVDTGSDGYVADKCEGGGGGGGGGDNLPGLDATQTANAQGILQQVGTDGVGLQGCLAGFATALVESNIFIYANEAVPESLNYPYDKMGSDHDSVGIFQQRATFYPDIAANMDPARSAGQFFAKMVGISGWETMDVGELCQAVQVSAYPDRYAERVEEARAICNAGGIS